MVALSYARIAYMAMPTTQAVCQIAYQNRRLEDET